MAVSGILMEEKLTKQQSAGLVMGLKVEKATVVPWAAYPGSVWRLCRARVLGPEM